MLRLGSQDSIGRLLTQRGEYQTGGARIPTGAGGLCLGSSVRASPSLVLDACLGSQPQHPWLRDMRSRVLPPPSPPAPRCAGKEKGTSGHPGTDEFIDNPPLPPAPQPRLAMGSGNPVDSANNVRQVFVSNGSRANIFLDISVHPGRVSASTARYLESPMLRGGTVPARRSQQSRKRG